MVKKAKSKKPAVQAENRLSILNFLIGSSVNQSYKFKDLSILISKDLNQYFYFVIQKHDVMIGPMLFKLDSLGNYLNPVGDKIPQRRVEISPFYQNGDEMLKTIFERLNNIQIKKVA